MDRWWFPGVPLAEERQRVAGDYECWRCPRCGSVVDRGPLRPGPAVWWSRWPFGLRFPNPVGWTGMVCTACSWFLVDTVERLEATA